MNFESFGLNTSNTNKSEQKATGLDGMCEKCHGSGKTRVGLFDKRMCGKCHGKGFLKTKTTETESEILTSEAVH